MQSELNSDLLLTTCIYLILMSYSEYSVKFYYFFLFLTVSGVTCTFNNGMCDFLSQSHDDNDDWLIGQVMICNL